MLEIKNLKVSVNNINKNILDNLNLKINPGEVHAIMGPNGSGKSTLANILAGRSGYQISGEILYRNHSLLELTPDLRAQQGIFMAFQYPQEIPGVSNINFLKHALNAKRKAAGLPEIDAAEFLKLVREKSQIVGFPEKLLSRSLNAEFSGGEKKRNEILQMLLLEPSLVILDEIDSGLDIDALQLVGKAVNILRAKHRSFIIITHYQRLLDYINPDYVHVLAHGKIIKSGESGLALELEKKGYAWL